MRSISHTGWVFGAASSLALLTGAAAQAQTTTQPASPPAAAGAPQPGFGEVVVVARRTAERLQDVPISVTAISAQTLKTAQVQSGTDLIKLVPSLSVQQRATGEGVIYALRGINDGVITYFNEVPVRTEGVDDQIWDLSSVQALAGPQGTLFGRNGTGGAILFIPQRPTDKFEGYLDASYGNFNYTQFNAVVNLPINDMLKVRLGYRLLKHDPFVKNIGGGRGMDSENRNSFRASVLFQPTANISNYTVFDFTRRDESPPPQITSHVQPGTGCFGPAFCLYGPSDLALLQTEGLLQNALGIRTISNNFPTYDKATNYGVSNIFNAELGHGLTFKYIFGYRYAKTDDISSKTGFTLPVEVGRGQILGQKDVTNEVQLLGKMFDNRLTWTIGGFFSQETLPSISEYQLFAPAGSPFETGNNIQQNALMKNNSTAVYAQGTFAVTDRLNFTAGVRYTQDKASSFETSVSPAFTFFGPSTCALVDGAVGVNFANCTSSLKATFSAVTYNFSLDYHISKNVMVYATTRRGYNGGGFNTDAPDPAVAPPGAPTAAYQPEYLTDYEVGAKTEGELAGMPFRADVSAFLAKYTNIQRTGFAQAGNPPRVFSGTINGPKATIYGVQLQTMIKPFHDLTLALNYGFLHTQFDEGSPAFPKDNVFAQAPMHTLNVSANYHHELPAGGALIGAITYTYQSSETFADNNFGVPFASQPGFGVIDAQVGWQSVLNSPVDVTLFVKNLTNVAYAVDREDETQLGLGFVGTVYNDPRTFGVSVHYHFGG